MKGGTTSQVLERSRLAELLRALGNSVIVYAPVASREPEHVVELEPVAGPGARQGAMESVTLEYANTRHSPKRLFFPQTETMFRYDNDALAGSAPASGAIAAEAPGIVAFGVRPCDALALTYLDKIFAPGLTSYGDPYYTRRRERSTVVAFACSAPCGSCFCTAVGRGPAGTQGADVLVTSISGGRLCFEAVTDKGSALLETGASLWSRADGATKREVEAAHAAAAKAVPVLATPEGRVDRDAVKARMDKGFEDPIWNRLTESCIGCGACTYLCPTCHCFDIADEQHHYQGRRIRTWDSCQYPQFTRHASGHNPRPARKHRLRQRFMHKFSYTVEKSGDIYCVGCGRCVVHCPVNLDIREVIRAFSAPGA